MLFSFVSHLINFFLFCGVTCRAQQYNQVSDLGVLELGEGLKKNGSVQDLGLVSCSFDLLPFLRQIELKFSVLLFLVLF
jgi:hypothetical protein